MRTPIIGGNWKMNTDRAGGTALAAAVEHAAKALPAGGPEVIVFPPFVYLDAVRSALGPSPRVQLGAQDCYHAEKGAFTGEIAPTMLKDIGCRWVLAGHSERRHVLHEGDDMVNMKARSALAGGLNVVLCVGEKLEQRITGQTDTVNERQVERGLRDIAAADLARIVIAYEPVWAIGTGKVATPDDAQSAHAHIRSVIKSLFGPEAAAAIRIQYGGSVTAASAAGLFAMPDIDGFLVGGASLKPDEFAAILKAGVR
jgi:triosephosphate isomerase (TIM)